MGLAVSTMTNDGNPNRHGQEHSDCLLIGSRSQVRVAQLVTDINAKYAATVSTTAPP
jgi:hypothetical protein